MTVRFVAAAAAIAASFVVPAAAQEGQTFEAWGHTFNKSGAQSGAAAIVTRRQDAIIASGVSVPLRAYVSGNTGIAVSNEFTASAPASRTLNVWGARFDAPTR